MEAVNTTKEAIPIVRLSDGRLGVTQHCMNVMECISLMWQREEMCDVTLVAKGKIFQAHKVILCANSQYFSQSLSDFGQCATQTFENIPPEGLEKVLAFFYTGLIAVTGTDVQDLYTAAKMLGIPILMNICNQYFSNFLDPKLEILPVHFVLMETSEGASTKVHSNETVLIKVLISDYGATSNESCDISQTNQSIDKIIADKWTSLKQKTKVVKFISIDLRPNRKMKSCGGKMDNLSTGLLGKNCQSPIDDSNKMMKSKGKAQRKRHAERDGTLKGKLRKLSDISIRQPQLYSVTKVDNLETDMAAKIDSVSVNNSSLIDHSYNTRKQCCTQNKLILMKKRNCQFIKEGKVTLNPDISSPLQDNLGPTNSLLNETLMSKTDDQPSLPFPKHTHVSTSVVDEQFPMVYASQQLASLNFPNNLPLASLSEVRYKFCRLTSSANFLMKSTTELPETFGETSDSTLKNVIPTESYTKTIPEDKYQSVDNSKLVLNITPQRLCKKLRQRGVLSRSRSHSVYRYMYNTSHSEGIMPQNNGNGTDQSEENDMASNNLIKLSGTLCKSAKTDVDALYDGFLIKFGHFIRRMVVITKRVSFGRSVFCCLFCNIQIPVQKMCFTHAKQTHRHNIERVVSHVKSLVKLHKSFVDQPNSHNRKAFCVVCGARTSTEEAAYKHVFTVHRQNVEDLCVSLVDENEMEKEVKEPVSITLEKTPTGDRRSRVEKIVGSQNKCVTKKKKIDEADRDYLETTGNKMSLFSKKDEQNQQFSKNKNIVRKTMDFFSDSVSDLILQKQLPVHSGNEQIIEIQNTVEEILKGRLSEFVKTNFTSMEKKLDNDEFGKKQYGVHICLFCNLIFNSIPQSHDHVLKCHRSEFEKESSSWSHPEKILPRKVCGNMLKNAVVCSNTCKDFDDSCISDDILAIFFIYNNVNSFGKYSTCYKCLLCSLNFKWKRQCKEHLKKRHKDAVETIKANKIFQGTSTTITSHSSTPVLSHLLTKQQNPKIKNCRENNNEAHANLMAEEEKLGLKNIDKEKVMQLLTEKGLLPELGHGVVVASITEQDNCLRVQLKKIPSTETQENISKKFIEIEKESPEPLSRVEFADKNVTEKLFEDETGKQVNNSQKSVVNKLIGISAPMDPLSMTNLSDTLKKEPLDNDSYGGSSNTSQCVYVVDKSSDDHFVSDLNPCDIQEQIFSQSIKTVPPTCNMEGIYINTHLYKNRSHIDNRIGDIKTEPVDNNSQRNIATITVNTESSANLQEYPLIKNCSVSLVPISIININPPTMACSKEERKKSYM